MNFAFQPGAVCMSSLFSANAVYGCCLTHLAVMSNENSTLHTRFGGDSTVAILTGSVLSVTRKVGVKPATVSSTTAGYV